MPVGLSSVIVQSQALFTIGFAALIFREMPTPMQGVGIAIATAGLLMICGTVGYDFSVGAFAMILICPVSFAIGNLLLRQAHGAPMFDLFAWLCLDRRGAAGGDRRSSATVLPRPGTSSRHASLLAIVCMLALGGLSTSIAYWLWGRLLRDYPAAQVVPFALLVPFVGSGASSIVFGEKFGPLRLAGMLTVIGGIAIMLLAEAARAELPEAAGVMKHVSTAPARLCRVRRGDVLHAGAEQHHAAVVGPDLRLPPHRCRISLGITFGFAFMVRRGRRRASAPSSSPIRCCRPS